MYSEDEKKSQNTKKEEYVKMSITEPIEKVKGLLGKIIKGLKGGKKRRAVAEIAKEYGVGGESYASKEYGMSRRTIRKGMREQESGEEKIDKFRERGRKRATEKLPKLEEQIRKIISSQSQADPKFQTERLYTNMSVSEVRRQLALQYEYKNEELPVERTLNTIINKMGYTVKAVRKSKPIKKIPETELIFYNLERIHELSSEDESVVRLSIDTKDKVKVGEFSRGGESRVETEAYDHDFGDEYAVPFGIFDVKEKDVEISISESKVTADFMADRLEEYWYSHGYSWDDKILLLNADNGPENNSSRTQFIKRMVEFSAQHNTEVILAYYPPYHSKYNPVERVWGVLEQHWNGELLDTKEAVLKYAESMTYAAKHPVVRLIDEVYKTGVKVGKKLMSIYEKALDRMAGLEKWFIRISPAKAIEVLQTVENFQLQIG